MAGIRWTKKEVSLVKKAREESPHLSDNQISGLIARRLKKSPEAVRWQLRQFHKTSEVTAPKILLVDIETLFLEAKMWAPWDQNIQPYQIKKDWSIVCWSAKWLFDDKVMGEVVKPREAIERKDASILPGLWKLMNEAHVVITHNGNGFDIPKMNTRFLIAGMNEPMYYQSIDTLAVCKSKFSFTYNKMDYINAILGIGRKIDTAWKWWDECSNGNQKYLAEMLKYNKRDVNILEELYMRIRPWISNHPNLALYSVHGDIPACKICTSVNLEWGGVYTTPLGMYKAFRCECGAIGRSTRKEYKLASSKVQG